MAALLGLLILLLCLGVVARTAIAPSAERVFLAVIALFCIGYYALPTFAVAHTGLAYVPPGEVAAVAAMSLLYLAMLFAAFAWTTRRARRWPGLSLPAVDGIVTRSFWPGVVLCGAGLLYYYSTQTVTFYQTDSVDNFVEDRSVVLGVVGFFVALLQAAFSLYAVDALQRRDALGLLVVGGILGLELLLLLAAGQRLAFIAPVFMLLAALAVKGKFRTAGLALVGGIVALVLVSPFAIAIRSASWNSSQDIAAESFSYGANPLDTMYQSILDRADLLENMASLKTHIDASGHVPPEYYASVLAVPVPRALYPDKPVALSDTGDLEGEITVLAWNLKMGARIGSLTAFGPIVAYREGGWFWVAINALLSGAMFAAVLSIFARGGRIGQILFCTAFIMFAVQRPAPSLFEGLVGVLTYLPLLLALVLAERLLRGRRRVEEHRAGTRSGLVPSRSAP